MSFENGVVILSSGHAFVLVFLLGGSVKNMSLRRQADFKQKSILGRMKLNAATKATEKVLAESKIPPFTRLEVFHSLGYRCPYLNSWWS
jgi:hypothetical protein